MANIRTYLHGLEARLAPTLDAQSLQERLTEAENHLRDRAQEFEEVGLPPAEAEARAVAAFGEPEEYVADLPLRVPAPALVAKPEPRGDFAFQLAASAVAIGVLTSLGEDEWPFMIGGLVAAVAIGLGAVVGRPTPFRRLFLLGLGTMVGLFALLSVAYLPGYDPLVAMNHRQIRETHWDDPLTRWSDSLAIDRFHDFERMERRLASDPAAIRDRQGLSDGPDPDGTLRPYILEADARRAWRTNGDEAHEALLAAARREGLYIDVHAPWRVRVTAFALDAFAFGAMLLALATACQALGGILHNGLLELNGHLKRLGSPRDVRSPERR